MGEDFKHIDQLFRDKLENYKEAPPAYIKERLDEELNALVPYAETVVAPAKKNYRWMAAAILLLLLSGAATLIVWNSDGKKNAAVAVSAGSDQSLPAQQNIIAEDNNATGQTEQPVTNKVSQQEKDQKSDQQNMIAVMPAKRSVSGIHQRSEQQRESKNELRIIPSAVQGQEPAPAAVVSLPAVEEAHIAITRGITETAYVLPELSANVPDRIAEPVVKTVTQADVQKQLSKPKTSNGKKFAFTAFYAPERSTSYMYQNFAQHRDERKEEIRRTEDDAYTYTVGLLASYDISSRWTIESGLLYSAHSTTIHPKFFFARPDDDGVVKFKFNFSSGYGFIKPKMPSSQPIAAGDSLQSISSENVLHYVGIPITVKYNINIGRLSLFARTGVSIRILTDQNTETTYFNGFVKENSRVGHIKGLRPSYFTGIVSAGAEYSLGKHWALTFFPSFNFALTPINKDAPVKTYVSTLGFSSGIKFRL